MKCIFLALFAISAACLSGCANYRYVVTEPAQFAQTIPKGRQLSVSYDPLTYRLSERDRRLALSIENISDDVLTLTRRSYLVTPNGETRPLPLGAATIGPRSYVSMMLPPEARSLRRNPAFGLSLGFGYSGYYDSYYRPGLGLYAPLYHEPPYYMDSAPVWDWGRGQVRLRFHYEAEQNTNTFEHQFVIDRLDVKN